MEPGRGRGDELMVTRILKSGDPYLLMGIMFLTASGILLIYSAGDGGQSEAIGDLYTKQAVWWAIAIVVCMTAFTIPIKWWELMAYPLYALSICLLVLLILKGGVGGIASRWIKIGPVQIQPSEFAKIFTVMAFARYLGNRKTPIDSFKDLILPCILIFIPAALVALQPDLGTSVVFVAILLGTLFWSGTPVTYLFFLVVPILSLLTAFNSLLWGIFTAGLIIFVVWRRTYLVDSIIVLAVNMATGLLTVPFWERLQPYQRERVQTFLRPETDPLGSGWQIIQSKVAIGSGGLAGKGLLEGTQKKLAFLPAQHTDFIFSILGEEFGYLGVILFLLLFLFVLMRIIELARSVYFSSFSSLMVFGFLAIWFFHLFVNVGITLGIMPVTGLPLPFISYGGSFLVACYFVLGVLLRISTERFNHWIR
jgi:rod shape determining protein RodA